MERLALGGFIIIVLALLILAWTGYFTGGWESSVTEGK
jgi:hypothetical protein